MSVIFTAALMTQAKWTTRHSITHLQSPNADTAESSKFSMVENMPRLPFRAAPSGRPERANLGLCRTRARVGYCVCVYDCAIVCAYAFVYLSFHPSVRQFFHLFVCSLVTRAATYQRECVSAKFTPVLCLSRK